MHTIQSTSAATNSQTVPRQTQNLKFHVKIDIQNSQDSKMTEVHLRGKHHQQFFQFKESAPQAVNLQNVFGEIHTKAGA